MRGFAARQIIGEALRNNITFLDDDYNETRRLGATQVRINFENSMTIIDIAEYRELKRRLEDFY